MLGSPLEVELFAFGVCEQVCSLCVVKLSHLYLVILNAFLSLGPPHAAVLNCVEFFFDVNGCDPEWLVPLSGSLSELLERE